MSHESSFRCISLGDIHVKDDSLAVDPLSDAMSTTGDRMYTVLMLINVFMAWPQTPYNIVSYFQANLKFLPATLLLSKEAILFGIIIDICSHWMRKNAEVSSKLL